MTDSGNLFPSLAHGWRAVLDVVDQLGEGGGYELPELPLRPDQDARPLGQSFSRHL